MSQLEFHGFLQGGGAIAEAIAAYPWERSALGAIDEWPSALRSALSLVLNSKFPQAIGWGAELVTFYNDAFRPILGGKPEALGRSFREVWAEAWPTLEPIVARAFAGEATFMEDLLVVIDREGHPEDAYFTVSFSPIRDEDGTVRGMLSTIFETTDKAHAQQHARTINAELAHRIQNTFAITTAIVEQTFRSGHSADETRRRLNERIGALGRAHRLLTQTQWSSAPLALLVEQALAPHAAPEQITIAGPPFSIPAKKALSLSLALHELATNSLKYGALSVPSGRVHVEWHVIGKGAEREFHFSWTERNGPEIRMPTSKGFGSRLIEKILPHDFGGKSRLVFEPTGVRFELTTAEGWG